MKYPTFSIIIPIKTNGSYEAVLNSIRRSLYPKDKIEVLVTIGSQPSRQRNLAVKKARGELIYFLDNDSELRKDAFKRIVSSIKADIVGTGGPWVTKKSDTFLQQCFGVVFGSYFVALGTRKRFVPVGKGPTLIAGDNFVLCNFCIKKDIYLKEGGLNENLYPNEENEFFKRVGKRGHKFVYDPTLVTYRSQRKNIFAFMRQIFRYARGRADHFFWNIRLKDLFFTIPLIFLIYLLSLIIYHPTWYFAPLFFYLFLSVIFSAIAQIEARRKDLLILFFVLPFLFFLTHMVYGLGFTWGLLKKLNSNKDRKKVDLKNIKIKRVIINSPEN